MHGASAGARSSARAAFAVKHADQWGFFVQQFAIWRTTTASNRKSKAAKTHGSAGPVYRAEWRMSGSGGKKLYKEKLSNPALRAKSARRTRGTPSSDLQYYTIDYIFFFYVSATIVLFMNVSTRNVCFVLYLFNFVVAGNKSN